MADAELVIFDCDGVLADSEVISAKVLRREVARYGVALEERYVYRNFVGKSFPVVAGIIRSQFEVALPESFEAAYRTTLLKTFETELKPTLGVQVLLARMAVPRCVATSSSPPRLARTLELLNLTGCFGPNLFTASQVEHGKPAPDLFLLAAGTMGVDPSRCLVIEDSLAGVQAGQAAEMEVWRYIGGSHFSDLSAARRETPPDVRVFDNWSEFPLMAPELLI